MATPQETALYRVKFISHDEVTGYSGVVHFDNQTNTISNETKIDIYPNPASEKINIAFVSMNQTPVQIVIHNYLGEEVMMKTENAANNKTITLNVGGFASGVYFVSFIQGGINVGTRKVIISSRN